MIPVAVASGYAAWLNDARQALSQQQHLAHFEFTADNTSVTFDNISYATCKVLPEQQPGQE